MARRAVSRRVVVPMTVDAVPHLERPHLLDLGHAPNIPMAQLARPRRAPVLLREVADMRLMHEVYVIGNAVHANPIDRNSLRVEVAELLNLRQVVAHGRVATHAKPNCRYRRSSARIYVSVAERAVEADVLDVGGMGEGYRLIWPVVEAEGIQRQPKPGRNDERPCADAYGEQSRADDSKHAK